MDTSKTVRNMAVVLVLGILTAGLSYFLRFYIARTYTVEEYGLVYSMLAFFSFMVTFVDLGLFQAQIKRVAELRVKKDIKGIKSVIITTLFFQLGIALILSILMWMLSPYISKYFFHITNLLFFNFFLVWFLSYPLNYPISVYTLSFEKTKLWSLVELGKILFLISTALLLTFFNFGILSIMAGYAMVNIVAFIFIAIKEREFYSGNVIVEKKSTSKEMIKYGLIVASTGLAWTLLTQTDTLMITYFLGLKEVGLYQVAVPLAMILSTILNSITIVLLSKVSNLWANRKKKETSNLIIQVQKYILVFILPITLLMFLYGDLAIKLLFGLKYLEAKNVLSILSFAYLFTALSTTVVYIMIATGQAKKILKNVIIGSVLNIILIYLTIHKFGITGVACAVLITNIVIFSILVNSMNKILRISFPIFIWIKTLFASILFMICIWIFKSLLNNNHIIDAIISICISEIIYIFICFFLGVLTLDDFNFLKNIKFIK